MCPHKILAACLIFDKLMIGQFANIRWLTKYPYTAVFRRVFVSNSLDIQLWRAIVRNQNFDIIICLRGKGLKQPI
jgi:hypothetical protein